MSLLFLISYRTITLSSLLDKHAPTVAKVFGRSNKSNRHFSSALRLSIPITFYSFLVDFKVSTQLL